MMAHGCRYLWMAVCALALAVAAPASAQAGFAPSERVLSEGMPNPSQPTAAIDPDGDTVAAWVQEPAAGASQIAVRRIAADGALGPVTVVSAGSEQAFAPALAVAPDGSFFVAWTHTGAEAGLVSAAGRWVHADGTIGPILPLLESSATQSAAALHVVVTAGGVATVAWIDQAAGQKDRVELRRISPASEQGPEVDTVLDAAGSFAAAPLPSGATLLAAVAMTDVVSAEGAAAAPENASTSGGADGTSGLAVDRDGEGLLAWRRGAIPGAVIARRIDATGLPVGNEIAVEPETASFIGADENVAANSNGRFLVGWYKQDVGNAGHGYVRAVTVDGLLPDSAHAVTAVGKAEPSVALDDAGSGLAAMSFAIGETTNDELIGSALDLDGTPLAEPLGLSGGELPSALELSSEPASGVATAIFEQGAPGAREIAARRFMEPPTCASTQASVVLGKPVAAPIGCEGIGVTSIHAVSPPLHGTLSAFASASVTYTPTPGYQGADSFSYVAENEAAVSAPATVSVSVGAAPAAAAPPKLRDTTPPTIRSFKLQRTRTRATRASRGKPRFAYAFRLSYSEPASVRITLERPLPGIVRGKSCRPRHAHARGRRCTIYRRVRTLSSSKLTSSLKLSLSAKLVRELASLGSLRASALATDAAGNRSRVRRLTVHINER